MTYKELVEFLEDGMSMSHIYQPLLIKTLVDSDGTATLRQLAQAFLSQDESQLIYYEDKIKSMPVKVLAKHNIVKHDQNLVTLNIAHLTLEQKAHIRLLCERRLQEYIKKRGIGVWDYRLLERNPVPDNLRYQTLRRADGRCELCGATKKESLLDVDHIIPISRGGNNSLENLQVLCSKCNRTKGNKDEKDFRSNITQETYPDCPFCVRDLSKRTVLESGTVRAIKDTYPVTEGHTLVIPKRHTPDYFSMTETERRHAEELIRVLRNRLVAEDRTITGFNLGTNAGLSAGQTVFHAHIHLIPRRDGDTRHPRGGIRGVIPNKMDY